MLRPGNVHRSDGWKEFIDPIVKCYLIEAVRLVFQLAEVLVTREMLTGMLERISRVRLAPG